MPPDCTNSAASLRNAPAAAMDSNLRHAIGLRATSTIRRPSNTVSDSGFSTYTSLPALQASMHIQRVPVVGRGE